MNAQYFLAYIFGITCNKLSNDTQVGGLSTCVSPVIDKVSEEVSEFQKLSFTKFPMKKWLSNKYDSC